MDGLNEPAKNLRRKPPGPEALPRQAQRARSARQAGKRSPRALLLLCLLCTAVFACFAHGAEPVTVVIEGVSGNARKNVEKALELPYGLVKDGKVELLWLERFVRRADRKILAALEPFGYYSARAAVHLENPQPDVYLIRVSVEPGPPVIVSDVRISLSGAGAAEPSLVALAKAFPLAKDAVLLHESYEQGKRALQTRAQELGYLDADYSRHEIRIDPDAKFAQLTLVLETGERYYFSTITLEGAPDYPDDYVRRHLTFAPGDTFSYARLAESQLQLNNSERFREVVILAQKEKAQDRRIPVRILLKQAPRRSLRPGLGYGTDTGARFALRYRDLNMLTRGHELDTHLFISERLQGLAANYIIPGAKDIRTFTSVRINAQHEDVTTYRTRLIALELARNTSFGPRRDGSVYVRFQQEEYTIGLQDASSRYVLPGVRFSENRYDNLIRPRRGFRYALDLRGTHMALGSTTQLLQLIGEAGHVLSLPWRLSLATSVRAGITFLSDPLDEIPASLRFFAGGDQSVRGYAYQSLGPKDALGNVVGGKHLFTGSVELQRALFDNWAVSAFYNAGNAFDSFADVRLYQAAGAGIHYFTPVGALNLSLARQIGVEEPRFRIHFTVGFEF